MRYFSLTRLLGAALLVGLCALSGFAQNPPQVDPKISKEIDELEMRLKKLQGELKALKDKTTATSPPTHVGGSQGMPAHLDRLFDWRSIGPANMGGRITALAVFEADPTCFYVATASGGLLKTINNGSTFTHHFDREATVSIGAVAVAPTNKDIVWVGTGEANPRNSVSYGDGVYRSTDGGKTWKNMGLKKSFQIGKIVIHPKNPDVVYVAALGRLYGPNEERGLYKTSDAGKTWQRVWHHDDKTGVLDLAMSPADPDTLLLAAWQRQRDAFDSFMGDAKPTPGTDAYAPATNYGPGGGIYRSSDGGTTWKKITQGLPNVNLGRIGLDWDRKNPKRVLAIVDAEKAGMGLPPAKVYFGISPVSSSVVPPGEKYEGVRVAAVQKDSPAAKAGLLKGDLLLSIDGKGLRKVEDLFVALQPHDPGDKIELIIQRNLINIKVPATLAPRPGADKKSESRGTLGIQLEESEDGLVVVEIAEKGAADKAGLKAGDVILALQGSKLGTLPTLFKTLAGKKVGEKVTITYRRGGEQKELEITLEAPQPGTPERPYSSRLGGQRANVQDQQGPVGTDTGGIYESTNAGDSWTRINSLNERPFYFSVVRADPNDSKTIYALGVSLYRSTDAGITFADKDINKGVHSDLHDLWIDPRDSRHIIIGTDGGVYVSYDRAAHWEFLDYLALGQFYHVAVDSQRPYNVYGGLQDNGSWGGPSQTLRPSGPTNADYRFVQGGDGFVCRVDPNDPDCVYAESQDGMMVRRNLRTGESKFLRPKMQAGAGKYRFNWNTPFILSQHNSHIFYAGGNYVFRSVKQGEDAKIISPEITRTKHGSATALAESPRSADVLWVGTDDGAVWLTRDGGKTWSDLSGKFKPAGLPAPCWVASIEPSRVVTGRCYVVFDAHRSNDDNPHVYVTEDFGQTWKSLRANLPIGSSRVLREDLHNPDLLYLGTEFAVYASLNRGTEWFKINGPTLPTVAVHEIAQPTTASEIVAATHGRSFWVLDVATLRRLKPDFGKGHADLFVPDTVTRWQLDFTHEGMFRTGTRVFVGQNPQRGAVLDYLLPKKADKLSLKIVDPNGELVRSLDVAKEADAGFHRVVWDLSASSSSKGKKSGKSPFTPPGQPAKPGQYRVVLDADGEVTSRLMTIEPDPRTRTPGILLNEAEELRRLMRERP
jgi:photosystem II stability/assembly factor-like uncharacterized protein